MRICVLLAIITLLVGMIAVPAGIAAPLAQQPENTPTLKWDTPTPLPPPPTPTSTPEPPTSTPEPPTPTAAPTTKPQSRSRDQPSPTPVLVLLPETGEQNVPLGLTLLALLVPAVGLLLRAIGRLRDR